MFALCSDYRMRTRGDMLIFAIAFALRGARKLVRGLREELTEEERYRVANDVVHRLKQHGDPWRSRIYRHPEKGIQRDRGGGKREAKGIYLYLRSITHTPPTMSRHARPTSRPMSWNS